MTDSCNTCSGYNFVLLGCCSGRECGCMGQPVESEPCKDCNKDGAKDPTQQAKQDYPWFFMNAKEFAEYEKSNNTNQKGN